MSLLSSLTQSPTTVAAELRPPRAELDSAAGINAWIDTYHAVRGLTQNNTYVLLTDSAVGRQEEHNLRHLVTNLGHDAPRDRVVPFLTAKHTLDYCLDYANRAWEQQFRSLVVLGGDTSVGPRRCTRGWQLRQAMAATRWSAAHVATWGPAAGSSHTRAGWQLRQAIRQRQPELELGGWVNPHRDPRLQVGYLLEPTATADFFLTQVVSHHDMRTLELFLDEATRQNLAMPGLFGVFYYRSANRRTLDALAPFLPVPREALIRDFARGATALDVCSRTVRALRSLGIRNVYISNLPVDQAPTVLREVLRRADDTEPT